MGITYERIEDYTSAIASYTKTIKLNPNYARAYENRGNLVDDQGDHQAALADYKQAIRLDPNNYSVYYNQGVVLLIQGLKITRRRSQVLIEQ